jgi:hypothetical protein
VFVQTNRLAIILTRKPFRERGPPPESIIQRVGIRCWARGFSADQLYAESVADPGRDRVLQGEQVSCVDVEPLRPQMRTGLGIDKLGVDADVLT